MLGYLEQVDGQFSRRALHCPYWRRVAGLMFGGSAAIAFSACTRLRQRNISDRRVQLLEAFGVRSGGALQLDVDPDMTAATEYVELEKKIELFEGRIDHMYLDSNGFVTVGVGHMIPNAAHAAGLAFHVRKTGAPTTEEQKKEELDAVVKETKGKVAGWYKSKTTLFMKPADVDALTKAHIESFEKELKNLYSPAPTLPASKNSPKRFGSHCST